MRIQIAPLILLLFALVLPSGTASAGETAPFGLTWGVSTQELEASGVRLAPWPQDESGLRFSATNLPKALPDLSKVILSFGNDDRLQKVEAISGDYRYDYDGARLKARYESLSRALSAKYGKGEVHHKISAPWNRPEDFLIGIHLGSSEYYTDFKADNVRVRLEIRASRRDVGSYAIVFRYREPPPKDNLSREKDVL